MTTIVEMAAGVPQIRGSENRGSNQGVTSIRSRALNLFGARASKRHGSPEGLRTSPRVEGSMAKLGIAIATALMLCALDMAMAFSHLLELPAKMRYDSRLWVTLQNSLYRPFGTVGAVIENGAVLSSLGLALVVRRSPAAFPLTLAGAACQALALGIWLAFVRPVNNKVSGWTAVESTPPEWTQVRRQWGVFARRARHSHAGRTGRAGGFRPLGDAGER